MATPTAILLYILNSIGTSLLYVYITQLITTGDYYNTTARYILKTVITAQYYDIISKYYYVTVQ